MMISDAVYQRINREKIAEEIAGRISEEFPGEISEETLGNIPEVVLCTEKAV